MVLWQAGSKVEVDYDTVDEIKVCRRDFIASLENDIKPVSSLRHLTDQWLSG